MAELHKCPDHKDFWAAFTKSAQEPALAENKVTVSLTITENRLGLIENCLRTSAATRIN